MNFFTPVKSVVQAPGAYSVKLLWSDFTNTIFKLNSFIEI
jgi:hypothetical protein